MIRPWIPMPIGLIGDPRWPVIAREIGVPVSLIAVTAQEVWCHGAHHDGRVAGFDTGRFAATFRVDEAEIHRVLKALAKAAFTIDGKLAGWEATKESVREEARRIIEELIGFDGAEEPEEETALSGPNGAVLLSACGSAVS